MWDHVFEKFLENTYFLPDQKEASLAVDLPASFTHPFLHFLPSDVVVLVGAAAAAVTSWGNQFKE